MPSVRRPPPWVVHALVWLFFLSMAVAVTWPLAVRFTEAVSGHERLAAKAHLWQFWWTREALGNPEWSLFHTPLLYFPRGLDTLQELGNFLLPLASLPFQALFGTAGGYNAVFLVFTAATGWAAWLFCRRFVDDRRACLAGGASYAFLPFALVEVFNGVPEISILLWMPLCLLFLLRCLEKPTAGRAAALGLLLFLAFTASWYYGFFLAVAVPVAGGAHLLREAAARRLPRGRILHLAACLALALGLFALLSAPLLLGVREAVRVSPDDWRHWSESPAFAAKANPDLLDYLLPRQRPAVPDAVPLGPEDFTPFPFALFPGFLTLALALAGLKARRRIPFSLWVAAGFFLLLSLGPYLKVAGSTSFAGLRVPLPMRLLAPHVPGFAAMAIHAYRAAVIPFLLLAVLAAAGAARLTAAVGRRPALGTALPVVASLLVAGEAFVSARLPWPLPLTPGAPAAVYRALGALPGKGAVIDIPITEHEQIAGHYMFAQTAHRRPILAGTSFIWPEPVLNDPLLRRIADIQGGRPEEADVPGTEGAEGELLRRAGYRYAVVHRRWLKPEAAVRVERLLAEHGPPVLRDDEEGVTIYRLEEPAAP